MQKTKMHISTVKINVHYIDKSYDRDWVYLMILIEQQ